MTVGPHWDRSIPPSSFMWYPLQIATWGQIPRPRPYKFISDLHSTEFMKCISYSSSESVEFSYSRLTLFGDVRLLVPSSMACIFITPSLFYKPVITLAVVHLPSFTTQNLGQDLGV